MKYLRALALTIVFGWSCAAVAQDDKPVPPAAKVKKALDETGDVSFDEQSLEDVVSFFKNRLKVDVKVDPSTPTPAAFFSVNSRGAKYREALKTALASQNLHFGVVGGTIVIGSESVILQRQMRQIVSIDATAGSLADILKNFADQYGANIVLDPRQKSEPVTLKLDDVPLETAVRLASELGGLRVVRLNNVLFITSDARADKLRADADGPVDALPNVMPALGGGFGNFVIPGQPLRPKR